jgi:long-subunit acyl-CoA synthetase (AMP-forming)
MTALDDNFTTLCEAFQSTVSQYPDEVALRTLDGSVEITWSEYAERVQRLAAGLAALGVQAGDTVALMTTNRPEALLVDTAAMHLGAIPFSVYNTSSPEQLEYLLGHARAGVVVTEPEFRERVDAVAELLPELREVIDLERLAELERDPRDDFEPTWQAVGAGDVATLIYTSGTTGPPKAVEITHGALREDLRAMDAVHQIRPRGRLISWLPLAHLADRGAAHYLSLATGATVTCLADLRQIVAALPQVRPTMFMAVPRVWEKLRAALEPAIAADPELAGQIADNLGLGDADLILSGAAPIAPEVLEFFSRTGIDIYEVWGMSEAGPLLTVSPPGAHRVGSVGRALPGIELRLAEDGELLVSGPVVMRGYRDDPERTAEVLIDGWMHTGDVGTIDADGYVRIIDRKKELIINAAGKNMSPANIENAIKAACPLVGSVVAIGDQRPYNTALIALDPDAVARFDGDVAEAVAAGIEKANQRLSRVEQVKMHTVLADAWEPGGDELTPTMKLKRKPIAAKYAAEIEAMYV